MTLKKFLTIYRSNVAPVTISIFQQPFSTMAMEYEQTYFDDAAEETVRESDLLKTIGGKKIEHFSISRGTAGSLGLLIYLEGEKKK